jgi:hypothetical protein
LTPCGLKPRASDIMRFIVILHLQSSGREVRDSIPIRVLCFTAVAMGTMRKWKEIDKICMMMTRLACNRAIESSYWRMDNNSDVGLLTVMCFTGYRLNWNPWIWIPFPVDSDCTLLCPQVDRTRYSSIASGNNCKVQLCKCVSLHL